MNKIEWVSEKEQQKELDKRIKNWKDGQSKDGFILAGEGIFKYKGIKYLIRVLRYYNHTNRFCSMGHRISDKHVVVEYPEETKPFVEIVKEIAEFSEFLYHDTNHEYNDKQTAEEQIEEAHRLAKEDIDNLFEGTFMKRIDEKIKHMQDLKVKLEMMIKNEQF